MSIFLNEFTFYLLHSCFSSKTRFFSFMGRFYMDKNEAQKNFESTNFEKLYFGFILKNKSHFCSHCFMCIGYWVSPFEFEKRSIRFNVDARNMYYKWTIPLKGNIIILSIHEATTLLTSHLLLFIFFYVTFIKIYTL